MQLLIIIGASLAVVVGAGVFIWRRLVIARTTASVPGEDEEWPLPPLFVPPDLARAAAAAARGRAEGSARIAPVNWTPPTAGPVVLPVVPAMTSPIAPPPIAPAALAALPPAMAPASSVPAPMPAAPAVEQRIEAPEQVQVGQVRFHRPPEGTLQLLPGRLEILRGAERLEEIRFVRPPGRDVVITFGRSPGEPHKHVQLDARTVSRQHASMRFIDGQWQITNLSLTNPVVVNGAALAVGDQAARVLVDGDQLEMGEVVFRFRAR